MVPQAGLTENLEVVAAGTGCLIQFDVFQTEQHLGLAGSPSAQIRPSGALLDPAGGVTI
jgi:hypothetical protein